MSGQSDGWLVALALLEYGAWSAVGLGAGLSAGGWVLDVQRLMRGESFTLWSFVFTLVCTAYLILPGALVALGCRWLQAGRDSEIPGSSHLVLSLSILVAAAGLVWRIRMGFPR